MHKITVFLLFLISISTLSAQEVTKNTAKPWAYWWWPGSAVNETDLATNLKTYADAGFGGMHIIPIYGVKGEEDKFIPYMSDRWLEILDFTVKEARKNGMQIDMSLGTGWPFGGAELTKNEGAKMANFEKVNGKYQLKLTNTGQKVKRAAPGGEGLVLDHFSTEAAETYFSLFGKAFKKKNYGVRAFYNDSYEVSRANWTNDFVEKFKELRGYDIAEHYDVLALDSATTEKEQRIWADYNQTLHDLLLSTFTKTYTDFTHSFGKFARNEAHGSPANILDLYGLSDVPETEFFGSKQYDIPGYRQDEDYEPSRFGTPTEYVMKMASSPAHILGKPLVSSETATWNANHFKGALSQIKPLIDESFVAGVNHVFYHGVPYSPPSAEFPGWLFYASTNFNQNSHFFKELPLLNRYIEVCQTRLQQSTPDNDVLILLPFSDLWHSVGTKSKMHMVDVHNITNGGIFSKELLSLLDDLKAAGISYDFISDSQLYDLDVVAENQSYLRIKNGLAKYKAVVIPKSVHMKKETASRLKFFHEAKVPVVFEKALPSKSFGYQDFDKRDTELKAMLSAMAEQVSKSPLTTLNAFNVGGEELGQLGLDFVRKINAKGQKEYFVSNLSVNTIDQNVWLNTTAESFGVFSPLTEDSGVLKAIDQKEGKSLIPFYLEPGQSVFFVAGGGSIEGWVWHKTSEELEIKGEWQVDFLEGNPEKPVSYVTSELSSWTNAPDTKAQYFDGYAKYSIDFSLSKLSGNAAVLSLGDVRETAKVLLNGVDLGTAWSLPFEINVPKGNLKAENHLEIVVRNTSANRIRLLDKEGVPWKKFYDINFVDITYTPFDASKWAPVSSGLLGPVKLSFE
ncbi:glycosyl hydrolase [Arcticibacterium luteifluviistationis]|uniref:Glycoside hydrolase n=1 Tax=Arcticibacterium luteifluviistationis TaxID=1784714 RepID=A0A2Z4GEB4_9BACT|nr:glycosyl hydrolase [Arcticibacterium luteifluviistationis]AWV99328.1 glycoside hydrolase [Arcticibacterium luteifluviistationis]